MSDNQIILQAWFGETPSGQRLEKNSFQIFVEGDEVASRRGGRNRELIGFVGKEPGLPINFLPLIDAFRDLQPQFEVQIRTALLNWRNEQVAAAKARLAEVSKAAGESGEDELSKLFAAEALKAAESVLQDATGKQQVESQVQRTGNAPDVETVRQMVEDLKRPVEQTDGSDDPDANEQNL